jgi:hypothetical protein
LPPTENVTDPVGVPAPGLTGAIVALIDFARTSTRVVVDARLTTDVTGVAEADE